MPNLVVLTFLRWFNLQSSSVYVSKSQRSHLHLPVIPPGWTVRRSDVCFRVWVSSLLFYLKENQHKADRCFSTDTDYLQWLPGCVKKTAYLFCYNKVGQHFSFCDYWNGRWGAGTLQEPLCDQNTKQNMLYFLCADPHHRACYLKGNTFLPLINGEIPHQHLTGTKPAAFMAPLVFISLLNDVLS